MLCGMGALYEGSPALGNFYVVTDGDTHPNAAGYCLFWQALDEAIVGMGFDSIMGKFKLPFWFIMGIAYLLNFIGFLLQRNMKVQRGACVIVISATRGCP